MAALDPQFMGILKKILAERFVPFLPPLLETTKPPADRETKQLSRAFSAFTLNKLLDVTPQVASASVIDDINDKGIDAIYYEPQSETLYLLQAKLKEFEEFRQGDAFPFCEGVRLLLQQNFAAFNVNVQNRKPEIESALDSCSHIQLVIPYTGSRVAQTAHDALQALLNDEDLDEERLVNNVIFYAADEIKQHLLEEQSYSPVHTDISLYKSYKIEEPHATYYGIARLSDLVSLHNSKGKALYERNIRYFLGSGRSDVNKAIKITLHDDPASFFYLNNGVTAVCEDIKQKGKNSVDGYRRFKVNGLSIINGAQTIASAAEFVAQNPGKNINAAKVMLTLIKAATDGAFGKRITKARNHQNPVQAANFASLDENQERLRQEMAHLGFDYHYRPESLTIFNNNIIKLDEALRALALLQNDPRLPIWLKSDSARLMNPDSLEYQSIFNGQLTGTRLINTVLCYRAIRELVVANDHHARGQERLIYRHGIHVIIYLVMKRLSRRIFEPTILQSLDITELLSRPFDEIRQDAFETYQRHFSYIGPLAFFRNLGTSVSFIVMFMQKNFLLDEDPVIGNLARTQNDQELYPQKRLIDYIIQRAPQL